MWSFEEKRKLIEEIEKDAHRICWLIAGYAMSNQEQDDVDDVANLEFTAWTDKLKAYTAVLDYVQSASDVMVFFDGIGEKVCGDL